MHNLIGEIVQVGTPQGMFIGTLQSVKDGVIELHTTTRYMMKTFAKLSHGTAFISGSFTLFKIDMDSEIYLQYRSTIAGISIPGGKH